MMNPLIPVRSIAAQLFWPARASYPRPNTPISTRFHPYDSRCSVPAATKTGGKVSLADSNTMNSEQWTRFGRSFDSLESESYSINPNFKRRSSSFFWARRLRLASPVRSGLLAPRSLPGPQTLRPQLLRHKALGNESLLWLVRTREGPVSCVFSFTSHNRIHKLQFISHRLVLRDIGRHARGRSPIPTQSLKSYRHKSKATLVGRWRTCPMAHNTPLLCHGQVRHQSAVHKDV